MTVDYGPPIRIGGSKPGGIIKIRRGGATRNGNSGTAPKRFHTPVRAIREAKGSKKGRHYGGKILPWPSRGKPIWDPRDSFIIEYRKTHPVVEAAWRKYSAHV